MDKETVGIDLRSSQRTVYAPGDVVRVRSEPMLSAVVLPTDGPPACVPENAPEVGLCCVPIALVRTPAGDENGVQRWVEISDLAPADPACEETAQ